MLSSLEEQEVLEKDSVSYDETSNMYWFVYADGTQGGVMLDEFSDDVSGSKNEYATTDSAGKVTNRNNKISWNTTDYPYEEENLHALFLYGLAQQGVFGQKSTWIHPSMSSAQWRIFRQSCREMM